MSITTHCQAELDTYCKSACPLQSASFHARLDRSEHSPELGWRCYAPWTLDADTVAYAGGAGYCTRHAHLLTLLDDCRRRVVAEKPAEAQTLVDESCTSDSSSALAPAETPSSAPQLPTWAETGVLTISAVASEDWAPSPERELHTVHPRYPHTA